MENNKAKSMKTFNSCGKNLRLKMLDAFTLDEIRVLQDMVDTMTNNPNDYTLCMKKGHIYMFCESKFLLNNIIDIIAKEGERLRLIEFMHKTIFDDLPIHINDPDPYGLVSRWRLKIGR